MSEYKTSNLNVKWLGFLLIGIYFGIVMTKSEVLSWYRIQEMFRFQAFHMFGVIGLAVVTGFISIQLIKQFKLKDLSGEEIEIADKPLGTKGGVQYWLGGTLFGMGWAMTGACPGPMYVLLGNGIAVFTAILVSAVLGAKVYGILRPRLPH